MATQPQAETKLIYQPLGVVSQALAAFADYEDRMLADSGSNISAAERRAHELLAQILGEWMPLARPAEGVRGLVAFEIDHMVLSFQEGPTPDDDHYLVSLLGVPVSAPIRSFMALGSALNDSLVVFENASSYANEVLTELTCDDE